MSQRFPGDPAPTLVASERRLVNFVEAAGRSPVLLRSGTVLSQCLVFGGAAPVLGARGRLVRGVLAQLLQAWMQRCWVTLSNANRIETLLVC